MLPRVISNSLYIRYSIAFLLIFSCSINVCIAQYKHLLHKTYGERTPLLVNTYQRELRSNDSVSVFSRIEAIKRLAIQYNDDDLLLETKLMRAHYFYYRKKYSAATVIGILNNLKDEGKRKKKIWLEAMAENMIALYYFNNLKKYELAFEHHLKVYQLIKNIHPKFFPYKQECLKQITDEYYFFEDYNNAIFFAKEALKAEISAKMTVNSFPSRLTILNTIGSAYQRKHMLDSADHFFRLVLKEAVQANSKIWEGIGNGNLGRNLFLKGNFNAARELLKKELAVAEDTHDDDLSASATIVLGDIYLRTGNQGAAEIYLEKAHKYVANSGDKRRLKDLYPLMSKLYAVKGNPKRAILYLDSTIFIRDSLKDELNARKMLKAKQRIDLEQYRGSLNNIETKRKINILERNLLLAFIVVMAGVVFAVFRSQRNKVRWQQQKEEKAREELANATRQLQDFSKNLAEKNALIQLLEEKKDGKTNEQLAKLRQSTILTEDDWNYFRSLFEKVHIGFFDRLKQRFPDLSPAEVRFMTLCRLNLSAREMASMLGVGADAIRQHRSRVRKKLALTDNSSPEEISLTI